MSGRIKADDIVYVREHAHIDEVVTAAGVALKNAGGGQIAPMDPNRECLKIVVFIFDQFNYLINFIFNDEFENYCEISAL